MCNGLLQDMTCSQRQHEEEIIILTIINKYLGTIPYQLVQNYEKNKKLLFLGVELDCCYPPQLFRSYFISFLSELERGSFYVVVGSYSM